MTASFDPKLAFSRNLGWVTEAEQEKLSKIHVGIIGMGGVGGQYAEILARLGVSHYTICDFDEFSIENTNRQNECKVSNYGRNKAEVITELIKDINPTATVKTMKKPLKLEEVDSFCDSIDIYLDALDFFVVDLRVAIFRKMRALGKPAVTAAPVGTGAACLIFTRDSMSFDDYFGFHRSQDVVEQSNIFLVGVAPTLQHGRYIQDRSRADFANRKVPSLPIGVYACAAVMATCVLKITLGRGKILKAPWSVHYDSYLMQVKKKYVWWGYRNPFQLLKLWILNRIVKKSLR